MLGSRADHAGLNETVELVEWMLKLHEDPPKVRAAPEKTPTERQISAADKQLDAIVYALYGLTEEEIRIVEGGNN